MREHLERLLADSVRIVDERTARFEQAITHERELRVANDQANADALRLQAQEYERRLTSLHSEYRRVDDVRDQFLSRERFDAFIEIDRKWKDHFTERFAEERGAAERQWKLVALGLTVVTLLLKFVKL